MLDLRLTLSFLSVVAASGCGAKVVYVGDSSGGDGAGGAPTSDSGGAGGVQLDCDPASHTVDPNDYYADCVETSNCVAVYLGDFCEPCSCPFWAINVVDLERYRADADAKSAGTPPDTCSCPAAPPVCEGGRCKTQIP